MFSLEEQGCWLKTSVEGQLLTVEGGGYWTVTHSAHLDGLFGGLLFDGIRNVTFDVSGLTALDTAVAHIIHRTKSELDKHGITTELAGLEAAYKPLLTIVTEAYDQLYEALHEVPHFILAMFKRVDQSDRTDQFKCCTDCLSADFPDWNRYCLSRSGSALLIPGGVQRSTADGNFHAFFGKHTTDNSCAYKRQAGENALARNYCVRDLRTEKACNTEFDGGHHWCLLRKPWKDPESDRYLDSEQRRCE